MMKFKIIGCPKFVNEIKFFFEFFYSIFQVRTSRNTFQVGECGVSKFSIILNVMNVSLNLLYITLFNVKNFSCFKKS